MIDIVSFETALRLKEAGFPQPFLKNGQFWYMEGFKNPRIAVVCDFSPSDQRPVYRYMDDNTLDFPDDRTAVFAPTAIDILWQLPDGYILSKGPGSQFTRRFKGSIFSCGTTMQEGGYSQIFASDSPALAASNMWIHFKSKK